MASLGTPKSLNWERARDEQQVDGQLRLSISFCPLYISCGCALLIRKVVVSHLHGEGTRTTYMWMEAGKKSPLPWHKLNRADPAGESSRRRKNCNRWTLCCLHWNHNSHLGAATGLTKRDAFRPLRQRYSTHIWKCTSPFNMSLMHSKIWVCIHT